MMVLVYSSLEEHLGVYEEVVWAAFSCLTQKCVGDPASIVPLESVSVEDSLSYEDVPVEILDRQNSVHLEIQFSVFSGGTHGYHPRIVNGLTVRPTGQVTDRSSCPWIDAPKAQLQSQLTVDQHGPSIDPRSVGGNSVAEKIKKTLALLEQSGFKNSTTRESYDLTNESPPCASCIVNLLKINLRDNPCYSPSSPMIMQTMVVVASSSEEQLANLMKLVEGLTKHVQYQESRIDKLMDRLEGFLDGEASYVPGKGVEV
ncbi:hypothetical protein MTR67_020596 [Solanum verrucosum]|uniref:Uncharacterized protein n=1 Tax=Solanum verrucosum TaxID=315347 RepID=A0AAF0QPX6_SOLVR|nr:hypothetical protein MTR67_020596 [Solanum verrucosum]